MFTLFASCPFKLSARFEKCERGNRRAQPLKAVAPDQMQAAARPSSVVSPPSFLI